MLLRKQFIRRRAICGINYGTEKSAPQEESQYRVTAKQGRSRSAHCGFMGWFPVLGSNEWPGTVVPCSR